MISTDGWKAYLKGTRGRAHNRIIVSAADGAAHDHLPAVHLLFTLLKRVLGTTKDSPNNNRIALREHAAV